MLWFLLSSSLIFMVPVACGLFPAAMVSAVHYPLVFTELPVPALPDLPTLLKEREQQAGQHLFGDKCELCLCELWAS